ncbi:MAG: hypothetical protein KBA26_00880 [Candidatus Delongbacteria bacterium]|nr:hypothetical protein [Candidatus Delongbacteria bacterium]
MKRNNGVKFGLILSLVIGMTGYSYGFWFWSDSQTPKKGPLTILHTNDTHAQIQGCGCRHAGGGLIKRSFKIKTVRDTATALLVLDAGNMLFGDGTADQSKGRFTVDAINLMKYDAVNLTPHDFRYGIDSLNVLQKLSTASFLSATIVDKKTRKAIFPAYKIFEKNGNKIAVIGVCDSSTMGFMSHLRPQFDILDVRSVLPELVKKLRREVNFIILLSYSGWDRDEKLVHEIPGIDLILGGITGKREYKVINQTTLGQAFRDGKYLGHVSVFFSGDKKVAPKIEGTIVSMENADLDDPAMRALIEKYK